MPKTEKRHIISILLDNEAGALSRVAGLFSARGYNIESLTVAETDNPSLSRITIVTVGADSLVNQVVNQLNKLIDVAQVQDLSKNQFIEREILLLKVRYSNETELNQLTSLIKEYGGSMVEKKNNIGLFELTAKSQQLEELIEVLRDRDLIEVARSGVVSLSAARSN